MWYTKRPPQNWQRPETMPYPERSFATMRNYQQATAPSLFQRSYADVYRNQNPTLDALIKRREAEEDYRRKFGNLPR
jgi:hypothetical protein